VTTYLVPRRHRGERSSLPTPELPPWYLRV
jgi:hypothetical protein